MHLPTISLALLSALAANAEFYIVGTSGEFADGYYGFPAVINDQGITFGDALACDHVGTAGSLKKTTNDKGQLLYEFCDVNDVAFAFNDQCQGKAMVIGGTGNRCGVPCDTNGECVSGVQFGVLYLKGEPTHTVGTCYMAGAEGWHENCPGDGSHIMQELVYCHVDEVACEGWS